MCVTIVYISHRPHRNGTHMYIVVASHSHSHLQISIVDCYEVGSAVQLSIIR